MQQFIGPLLSICSSILQLTAHSCCCCGSMITLEGPACSRRALLLLLLTLAAFSATDVQMVHAIPQQPPTSKAATSPAAPAAFQSIADIPGCSSSSSSSSSRALMPELSSCSWSFQMKRGSARWYAFDLPADAAENMSVVIMARAVSGRITAALWGPGSDPYRSVPTQVGTNYMKWPGLREPDQDAAAAEGGHMSIASEQQYLFLARKDKPLLMGQYVVVVRADMGQPLVQIEVSTPSSNTQLVADEQEALKDLVTSCCPGLKKPDSSSSSSNQAAAAAAGLPVTTAWCSSVGQAITYDLRQWYSDICHVAPNVCDKDGHLTRLVIPPYALHCPRFPASLGKFSRLQLVDLSYSSAPGTLADVADVIKDLTQLEQLHLRGVGLNGPLSCDLVHAGRHLQSLSLSDNDKLSGTLPACWLRSHSLQELQLAGLSGLRGPLPSLAGTSGDQGEPRRGLLVTPQKTLNSGSKQQAGLLVTPDVAGRGLMQQNDRGLLAVAQTDAGCCFGRLKYVNMAGVIGDAEQGLTGPLPTSLGVCQDLLYLDVSGHALSGQLPALPPQLQYVNLSSNALSGVLPDFARSPQLQFLDLSFNRFQGSVGDLTVLQNLDWVDLSDNELSGTLPALPLTVRWVDISKNALSGDIDINKEGRVKPGSQAELQMVLLNLSYNKFSGTLPVTVAVAPHLSFLDLSHNALLGSLDTFAAALKPKNQMLQINLSHNKLVGGVPEQLQMLAALRPVLVMMRDGVTPVHRIMDLSHNQLGGVFPTWLISLLPQVQDTCHCTVGVSLDAPQFTCPEVLPELNHRAKAILRRFTALQCVSGTGYAAQQVPIWQLASPSYKHYTRQQHKALAAQQQQQEHDKSPAAGTVAGLVIAAIVAAVVILAVMVAVIVHKRKQTTGKAADSLLQHFNSYSHSAHEPLQPAPSFEGMQASPNDTRHCTPSSPGCSSPPASGSPQYDIGYNSGYDNRNNSVTSSARSSSNGQMDDGICEIALVTKKGPLGLNDMGNEQHPEAKLKGRDGIV